MTKWVVYKEHRHSSTDKCEPAIRKVNLPLEDLEMPIQNGRLLICCNKLNIQAAEF